MAPMNQTREASASSPTPSPGQDKPKKDEVDEQLLAERAAVRRWIARYNVDKQKFEKDFSRMRMNMEFVTGLQHDGQTAIMDTEERYVANMTLRMVAQKTAQLYAKNPKVEAIPRKRLRYQLWDGSVEMLQQAFMGTMMGRQAGIPDMQSEAVMADFMNGQNKEKLVKRICQTLQTVDQYEIDTMKPEFKEQMKQAVQRTITTGVSYCRLNFVREGAPGVSSIDTRHTVVDRMKMMKVIMEKIEDDKVQPADAEMETLKSLALSLGVSLQTNDEYEMEERVEHDFLPATSVIPDSRCRSLKEFIAARWLFIEYPMQVDDINAMFGLEGDDRVKMGTNLMAESDSNPGKQVSPEANDQQDPQRQGKAILLEVFDYATKTRCFIVKGHKDYIVAPEPLYPCVSGFWPVFALVFNHVENEQETNSSIFPPSDVDLIRDPQREWNRTRDALRGQRNANAPTYLTRKGLLSAVDKAAIEEREPNEVIELENVPLDKEPGQLIQTLQVAKIDSALYDTSPLEQDMLLASGMQQANIGPAQPDVTATVGTIAEQSRMTVTSSNVDDLDDFLSRLARARGELRLQGMSEQVVKRIADLGAVWPTLNRSEFLNQIELRIVAASSGRPNKALEISNFERMAPFLFQYGNPIAAIEEAVKRLDDQLDVQKFFPLPGQFTPLQPAMGVAGGQPTGQGSQRQVGPGRAPTPPTPGQPPQRLQSGASVPLAAA